MPALSINDRRTNPRDTRDRRSNPRANVDLFMNRFVNGLPYMCRMTDISRTGIRVVPILEPSTGTQPRYVGLQFQLPGSDDVITGSGETLATPRAREGRRPGIGIRFTSLPAHAARLIDGLLGGRESLHLAS